MRQGAAFSVCVPLRIAPLKSQYHPDSEGKRWTLQSEGDLQEEGNAKRATVGAWPNITIDSKGYFPSKTPKSRDVASPRKCSLADTGESCQQM